MRKEDERAAAAAKELLKAAAQRGYRVAAANSRKGGTSVGKSSATVVMWKGKEVAAVLTEEKRSNLSSPMQMAVPRSEPSVAGGSPSPGAFTAPSPTSFSGAGRSCYFNGAVGFFNRAGTFFTGTAGQSPQPFLYAHGSDHATCGDELPRIERRILWTPEEDLKLMSSCLHNSTDPTIGVDRKNEQYWYDVVGTYNETTPSHRRRNAKQAKDRWHKVNKWTDLFHNAWVKARRIYTSGHNDQMWIDKAHAFYIEDNKNLNLGRFCIDGCMRFVLMDVRYAVRNEAKWITYNKGLKQQCKRKSSDKEKEGEDPDGEDVDDVDEQPRPMGQKKAKQAAREKKGQKTKWD